MRYLPVRIKARTVAGTGKALHVISNRASQMCADQTQSGESTLSVQQHSWQLRKRRARIQWIIFSGAILFGGRVQFENSENEAGHQV
jgi:hypothetical protein